MMPCDYKNYPSNWKTEIRPEILKRADNKCENCGIGNGWIGFRNKDGSFSRLEGCGESEAAILDGDKVFRVVLTISHTDHDLTRNEPENLKALCQRCHNQHDVEHRKRTKKNKGDKTGDLFNQEVLI